MKSFLVAVRLRLPDEVNAADVRDYVQSAVGSWGGQYEPDHPFFGIRNDVEVLTVKREDIPRRKKAPATS